MFDKMQDEPMTIYNLAFGDEDVERIFVMAVLKKEANEAIPTRGTVSDSVRSHANDPFFVKKNREAREALSKTDLSILKKK